ncbi:MAG: DNA methyltransferase [Smithellaceae bacterium]
MIAYRELRLLELAILKASRASEQSFLDVHSLINLNVDQFFGIEIEEFPAQIAQVALWLMDHQMNLLVSEEFGLYFARIPLQTSSTIVCGNALRIDWDEVIPARHVSYIMGNPPYVGAKFMNDEQRRDTALIFGNMKNAGLLDYVAAWYAKAARMMKDENIRCAFVSTNSITQGEQVGVLWSWMLEQGMKIFFAHRTFQWNNEARGKAAVHCVIIGFAASEILPKLLFEYEHIKGDPHKIKAQNINSYLVDAIELFIKKRSAPICNVPIMKFGNQPIDGGNLILSSEEKDKLFNDDPDTLAFVRKFLGADEYINNGERYCLWLKNVPPSVLKRHPEIMNRLEAVKAFRLSRSLSELQYSFE